MTHATHALPPMLHLDLRAGGPVRHAEEGRERARGLRDDCLSFLPGFVRPAMPLLDMASRRWLKRSASPYAGEVGTIAAMLGFSGVWFLNNSYQWGCTTAAREEDGAPWLARTLDWPFPGLGRRAELVRLAGEAGDYFSVTWPGYVGVLTGMAPRRFAAVINQAPMQRRTLHPWLRPYDLLANIVRARSLRHMPPDQLLRHAFETCATFADARRMLERTPIARPVIYTLVGCARGELCVIERTEEAFTTRMENVTAANDWLESRSGWEGRMRADLMLSCSFDEAAEQSRTRRGALAEWAGRFSDEGFGWVAPPVLNPYTRLAVVMCPAAGAMRVVGFDASAGEPLPRPVSFAQVGEGERAAA